MNKTQINVVTVLNRIIQSVEADETDAAMFADHLQLMLNDIQADDGFGTEGQCDPRGDFRSGKWSMTRIQK